MNSTMERLFETYGQSILNDGENYSADEVLTKLDALSIDRKTRLTLEEYIYERYSQWSLDAFSLGLHLGLSLLHHQVRRFGPQQG